MPTPSKVRIDKWLWAVRIFKTRSKSTSACRSGKVKVDGHSIKPSFLLKGGERIQVSKEGFNLLFEVVQLINKRVGYTIAQACYLDHTPESERNKFKDWFVGKSGAEFREKGSGRPSKKNRRDLEDFKSAYFDIGEG